MSDFARARTHMIQSQLQTSGVIDPAVLGSFQAVPREHFVPASHRGFCYVDDALALPGGRVLLAPLVLARLMQEANVTGANVLCVGGATGYGAAVVAQLAARVTDLEKDDTWGALAHEGTLGIRAKNINRVIGNLAEGYMKDAPYDAIIIEGAVAQVPQALLQQIKVGGRLVCILAPQGRLGQAVLYERLENNLIVSRPLFDVAMPWLPGFEPAPAFSFA